MIFKYWNILKETTKIYDFLNKNRNQKKKQEKKETRKENIN